MNRIAIVVVSICVCLASGCSDPVVLGPEHSPVVLQLSAVVTDVSSDPDVARLDVSVGEALEISVSYVPAHGSPRPPGPTGTQAYSFMLSERDYVTFAAAGQAWQVPLGQLLLQEGAWPGMDRIAASGGNSWFQAVHISYSFDVRDSMPPIDMLEGLVLPVDVGGFGPSADTGSGSLTFFSSGGGSQLKFEVRSMGPAI
jgi:hypothetical protein